MGWYSDDSRGEALYRLYNPYATTGELEGLGWINEGIAWYGVGSGGGHSYVLKDGVKEIGGYTSSGADSFTAPSGTSLKAGDKIVLEATDANPYGAAGTVTSVKKNANGSVTATFKQATDPAEVFTSLEAVGVDVTVDSSATVVSGDAGASGAPDAAGAGVSVSDTWSPGKGALSADFNAKLDKSGSYIKGEFSVRPKIGYDIKWTLFGGLERCELDFDGRAAIDVDVHVQNKNAGKDIKVLEVKVPLPYGFSVDVPLYVCVTAEGDLSVEIGYDMDTNMRLKDDEWVVTDKSEFDAELSAAIHLRLGGKVGAELNCLEVQLIDAAVEAGADGKVGTTVRDTGLVCNDLSAYGYADVEVGTGTGYLKKLGWTFEKEVINEKNSPLKLAWHFEDGVRVDECTWGKTPVDPDEPDVPGEPSEPDEPTNPGGPDTPVEPGEPADPVEPGDTLNGHRVTQVSLGTGFSAAVTDDGSLWLWGSNGDDNIGEEFDDEQVEPVKVMDDVASVSLGGFDTAAITRNGELWIWGDNLTGQIGNGETGADVGVPTKVMDDVKVADFGLCHAAAIKTDGSLWTWGQGVDGALGDGVVSRYAPKKILDDVVDISLGGGTTAAIRSDGSLWMWGDNELGQFGDGTTEGSFTPRKIMDGVADVATNGETTIILKSDGSVWDCGHELGKHRYVGNEHAEPELIATGASSVDIGGFCAAIVKQDGSLWVWGDNEFCTVGDGTTTNRTDPVRVMSDVTFVSMGGSHSSAIKSDGSLWMWGAGFYGQLGDGTTDNRSTPTLVCSPQ